MEEKAYMGKIILAVAVIVMVTIGGMYIWRKFGEPNKVVSTEQTQIQGKYENKTYGFSMVFPKNWGVITEKVSIGANDTVGDPSKIYASIDLESTNGGRFIKIQVVKREDKNEPAVIDYPQKYITENATYSYYYTGAGSNVGYPGSEETSLEMQNEVKGIIETFTINEDLIEPLSYSTTGVSVSVSKTTAPFDYTAERLQADATECGTEQEEGYFDELVAKFNGTTKIIYSFKYMGESQAPDTYVVTVIPNKAGYWAMFDQFTKDFNVCVAGGDAYPKKLNNDWLLFTSSCGSGYSDGSGKPVGCDEIRKIIEPTLKLNNK